MSARSHPADPSAVAYNNELLFAPVELRNHLSGNEFPIFVQITVIIISIIWGPRLASNLMRNNRLMIHQLGVGQTDQEAHDQNQSFPGVHSNETNQALFNEGNLKSRWLEFKERSTNIWSYFGLFTFSTPALLL